MRTHVPKLKRMLWLLYSLFGFIAMALYDPATHVSSYFGNGEAGIPLWSLTLAAGFMLSWFAMTVWAFGEDDGGGQ